MSRALVRSTLDTFLSPPNVTGINVVHRSPPQLIPGQEFTFALPPGSPSGTVAAIHISHESEMALTLGRHCQRQIVYTVGVILLYRAILSTGYGAEEAMDDYDSMVEALKAQIRTDPTLGSPGIFMAGRGRPTGAGSSQPDLEITSDLPKQSANGGALTIWSLLELSVAEMIQT